jgi:hypothetical protein
MEKKHIVKPISQIGRFFTGEPALGPEDSRPDAPELPHFDQLRQLTKKEINILEKLGNTCIDWLDFWVGPQFDPTLIRNCDFYGVIRIARLSPVFINYSDLALPAGFYNSRIAHCDFGENPVVDNVRYLANYSVGDEVVLFNINEMLCTRFPKFGNGALAPGEDEAKRIWLEIRNENLGRKVLPFEDMLPGDAFLWSGDRHNKALQEAYLAMALRYFDDCSIPSTGRIGNKTVIKNTVSIKDVRIGENAYIKGANKLKNLTIRSGAEGYSQIGEGCELVNGIIGYGCRVFYGVKAVRFILGDHSSLKYGARLINSYLGCNSVISCCEVLNSLIFSNHEQHHNNSFLCSALLNGQSNLAAGATIGSNHNSRAADGELIAGRGFWPGLCTSLKHNSRFASYCLLAKGDYPHELNIEMPFSLISNDVAADELKILPAYWFLYNRYALERNSWKYEKRDKRKQVRQLIDYDYLAPDTVGEIIRALEVICQRVAVAMGGSEQDPAAMFAARQRLEAPGELDLAILLPGAERGRRRVVISKVKEAFHAYANSLLEYGFRQLLHYFQLASDPDKLIHALQQLRKETPALENWVNVGGQLIRRGSLGKLKDNITARHVHSWEQVHDFYLKEADQYRAQKCLNGLAVLSFLHSQEPRFWTDADICNWLQKGIDLLQVAENRLLSSRQKDADNPFRSMVYENEQEMSAVLGNLESDPFIHSKLKEWELEKQTAGHLLKIFELIS